jgi:hypothetical protein
MDLQGTFGLVIPAFAETAALAVFLFVPFAAVRRSLMALRVISLRRKIWSLLDQQRIKVGTGAEWLGSE